MAELDPVKVKVEAEVADAIAKLRAVRDAIKDIRNGTATIRIKEDFNGAKKAAEDLAKSAEGADRAIRGIRNSTRDSDGAWKTFWGDIKKGTSDISGGLFRNLGGAFLGWQRNLKRGLSDVKTAFGDVVEAGGKLLSFLPGLVSDGESAGRAFGSLAAAGGNVIGALAEMGPAVGAVAAAFFLLAAPLGAAIAGLLSAAGGLAAATLGFGALAIVAIPAIRSLEAGLKSLHTATQNYAEASKNLNTALKTSKQDWKDYQGVIKEVDPNLRSALTVLRNSNATWQTLTGSQRRAVVALSQNNQALKDLPPAAKKALTALLQQKQAWDQLTPAQQKAAVSFQRLGDTWHRVTAAVQPAITRLVGSFATLVNSALPLLMPLVNSAAGALDKLLKRANNFVQSEKFKQWVHQVAAEIPGVVNAIGNFISKLAALIGPIVANKNAVKDLKNTLNALITIMNGVMGAIRVLDSAWNGLTAAGRVVIGVFNAINAVVSAMTGNIGGLIGSVDSLSSALSSLHVPNLGGIAGLLGGFAAGTPAAPPGLAWVGERGPELMSFTGGEVVIPNAPSMAIARGYAEGAGYAGDSGPDMVEHHSHIHLDGKQIYDAVQVQALRHGNRNGGRNGFSRRQ